MGVVLLFAALLAPLKSGLAPVSLAVAPARAAPQANASPTGLVSLQELRNRARPLLIFGASPSDPQLQIQLRRLQEHAAAMAERDIVIIAIPYQSPSTTSAMLSDDDAQAARRRFNVAPGDFQVILIGKDGGEKLRSAKPISADKLAETIDSMPMRQDEMRSKESGPGPR